MDLGEERKILNMKTTLFPVNVIITLWGKVLLSKKKLLPVSKETCHITVTKSVT
jgi:hypothetical protein